MKGTTPAATPIHSFRNRFARRNPREQMAINDAPQNRTCGHAAPSSNQPWLKASSTANGSVSAVDVEAAVDSIGAEPGASPPAGVVFGVVFVDGVVAGVVAGVVGRRAPAGVPTAPASLSSGGSS